MKPFMITKIFNVLTRHNWMKYNGSKIALFMYLQYKNINTNITKRNILVNFDVSIIVFNILSTSRLSIINIIKQL